ncbi:hypothetical protein EK21DRAFT_119478 [Setomelanomma holmii]|uniref:Uncharacterized protein n=1 Tax=Setomelanomma holmii TaxID=210430 RepID=A0A9P4GW95_9PLEO|nr:hypothetical protein EK21DRAFT_119478 [Setomelanomma holmii]
MHHTRVGKGFRFPALPATTTQLPTAPPHLAPPNVLPFTPRSRYDPGRHLPLPHRHRQASRAVSMEIAQLTEHRLLEASRLLAMWRLEIPPQAGYCKKQVPDDFWPRMRLVAEMTKVCYLASLDTAWCAKVVEKVMPGPQFESVNIIAHAFVARNCVHWSTATMHKMRDFVARNADQSENGVNFRHIFEAQQLHRFFFYNLFSLEDFETVFEFTNGYIDLRRSSPRALWWAKVLFSNMEAMVKLVIDVEKEHLMLPSRLKQQLSHEHVLHVKIPQIGQHRTLRNYVADFNELFFVANSVGRQTEAEERHVDEDDLVGCPEAPPGIDLRNFQADALDDTSTAAKNSKRVFAAKTIVAIERR